MKGSTSITVSVKLSWWLPAYIACVRFVSEMTGLEPDMDRVEVWIRRGIKLQLSIPKGEANDHDRLQGRDHRL